MSIISGNEKFGRELADALGMPKNTLWFELRVALDEPVTVKLAYYPEVEGGKRGELVETIRKYAFHVRETSALGDTRKTFEKVA